MGGEGKVVGVRRRKLGGGEASQVKSQALKSQARRKVKSIQKKRIIIDISAPLGGSEVPRLLFVCPVLFVLPS